jgi:transcriptional regulator with XRE-family HTH domain
MIPKKRVESLKRLIERALPGATIGVDAPARPSGDWFLDVKYRGHPFVVEFRPHLGFGLSSPSGGYGENADEFWPEEVTLVRRLTQLAKAGERTTPARARLLQELRSKRDVTQSDLAERLGIRQPTVSKIERREDVNLSTIRRYVQALGGELHVAARFADGDVEIALGPEIPVPASKGDRGRFSVKERHPIKYVAEKHDQVSTRENGARRLAPKRKK